MKIAIIGFAREGQAAFEYWSQDDHQITICDRNENVTIPAGTSSQLGADYLKKLEHFDMIVRTAGLHPREIAEANPETPDILGRVTTSVNEFLRVCPSRNIIGVTGTKGKGTTSVLIAKMLEAAGYRAHLGGNIGIPPLKLLENDIKSDDWVVLELSSFQLIDVKSSPHIAVCVMVSEEHLNWHEDYPEYIMSKQQLFRWQKSDDVAVYYGPNEESKRIVEVSSGKHIPYMQAPGAEVFNDEKIVLEGQLICRVSEIKLLGKHNWQNICGAATTVWQITHDASALHKAIVSMTSLPHRLEPIGEIDGIQYFNDSFSSAPPSTIAALDAIEGHKVLIIGGQDRGLNLDELTDTIAAHKNMLRKVIIIGQAAPRIETSLRSHGFTNYEVLAKVDMPAIVKRVRHVAQIGDKVVLSPGFSSFDMFKDFEDRGNQFKEAVNTL